MTPDYKTNSRYYYVGGEKYVSAASPYTRIYGDVNLAHPSFFFTATKQYEPRVQEALDRVKNCGI